MRTNVLIVTPRDDASGAENTGSFTNSRTFHIFFHSCGKLRKGEPVAGPQEPDCNTARVRAAMPAGTTRMTLIDVAATEGVVGRKRLERAV